MLVDGKLVRELFDFFKILLFLVLELLIFELLLDQLLVGSLGSNALILYLFFQFNNLCIFLLVTILRSLDCSGRGGLLLRTHYPLTLDLVARLD